jgi:hypothetical protein
MKNIHPFRRTNAVNPPNFFAKIPLLYTSKHGSEFRNFKIKQKNPNNRNLFFRSFLFFWKSVISFRPFFYFLFLLLFWFGFCDVVISKSVVILVWRSVVISRSGLCDVVVSVAEVVGWCLCVWLVVFVML